MPIVRRYKPINEEKDEQEEKVRGTVEDEVRSMTLFYSMQTNVNNVAEILGRIEDDSGGAVRPNLARLALVVRILNSTLDDAIQLQRMAKEGDLWI